MTVPTLNDYPAEVSRPWIQSIIDKYDRLPDYLITIPDKFIAVIDGKHVSTFDKNTGVW